LACGVLNAQSAPPVEFEVASIKAIDAEAPHTMGVEVKPGGRVVISALSLKALIGVAFHLSYWQLSGGEPWMAKQEYLIEATPPEEWRAKITNLKHSLFGIEDEHLRQMLQALLIDRFQLKFRKESRTGTVYLLKRSNKELRLQPAEVQDSSSMSSIGYAAARWVISASSMPQLAKFASDFVLHAPVLDQTGLAGAFDYRQRVPDLDPDYRDNSESFLRQMSEAGLKLERSQGPVEVLVIESAMKPSAN
jgi:uncharacterized protein (TIGR03435 family)